MNSHQNIPRFQDEIHLAKIVCILKASKNWVFGVPIVFLLLTAGWTQWETPLWEATATVQLGQVGEPSPIVVMDGFPEELTRGLKPDRVIHSSAPTVTGSFPAATLFVRSIEPSPETVEKLKNKSPALKVIPMRENRMLKVIFRDISADSAKRKVVELVQGLVVEHERMAKPSRNRLSAELSLAKKAALTDHSMAVSARVLELTELNDARWTFPTSLDGEVTVSAEPVYPKVAWALTMAIISGLLVGCMIPLTVFSFRSALQKVSS